MTQPLSHPVTPDCVRRDDCRLCGSRSLELVFKLAPTPPADHYLPPARSPQNAACYTLELFLCRDCHYGHLRDTVNPELLYRDYIYATQTSPGLDTHFRAYADSVLQRVGPAAGSRVVEFGSNDGTLLRCFRERGHSILGIDPATATAEAATAAGVETWSEYFSPAVAERVRKERGPASLLIANNVLANIDDLHSVAKAVRALLADDGVFVFESGYLLDLVVNCVFDNIYHEHISYFSIEPMARFFAQHGLELYDVERVPTKGGSIRVFVQRAKGPRKATPAVKATIELELQQGLDKPATYRALETRAAGLKRDLLALLDKIRSKGKTVAGFGASPSVTTLLYYFDLGKRLEFLADDNPRKRGTLSPGQRIPVYPASSLLEKKPDYVLILPWRFADAIRAKNGAFEKQGGRFIVAIPKVEVLG